MAVFKIPEQYASGLIALRALREESFQELIKVLASAPPLLQPSDLVAQVAPQISSIAETDLKRILETLISLCAAQIYLNLSISELAERVCDAMTQSDNKQLQLVGEECDSFRNRLATLLKVEPLVYPAKASGILNDHDRVFLHARILTDVRPVFGPDVEALPKGAVIVHTLNIAYRRGGKQDNFYVAMDSEDIESLIATLQRALSKAGSLKKLLDQARVTYLNPE